LLNLPFKPYKRGSKQTRVYRYLMDFLIYLEPKIYNGV